MRKCLILVFVFVSLLLATSCTEAPVDETTEASSEETTVISYTGMEGGFYVYEKEWQDYISGKREDYQVIAQSTPETVPMETTADPYQVLNELSTVPDVFIELADGSFHAPYASLVCAHVGNMVADGYLILRSTEDVLTMWVKDGLIPEITLTDGMTMRCGDELLADAYTFAFYTKDGDSFAKAATLADAAIDEVYRYGLAYFAGQTVYIRFNVKRIAEDGSADYAYLFMTEFAPLIN